MNEKIQEEVQHLGWANIAQKYLQNSQYETLTQHLKIELQQDLQNLINSEKKLNRRKKLEEEKSKIEKYFVNDPSSGIANENNLISLIFSSFFRDPANPLTQKWKNIFQGKNGVFSAIEECFDKFNNPVATAGAGGGPLDLNYAKNTIDSILSFMIEDAAIIASLKSGIEIADQTEEVQKFLFAKMENFAKSSKLRFATEQLYSELWLTLNKLGPVFTMDEDNTKLRNFIEHNNNIFETVDKNLSNISFLEFISSVISVDKKITRYLNPLPPSNAPAISSAGVVYNSINAISISI